MQVAPVAGGEARGPGQEREEATSSGVKRVASAADDDGRPTKFPKPRLSQERDADGGQRSDPTPAVPTTTSTSPIQSFVRTDAPALVSASLPELPVEILTKMIDYMEEVRIESGHGRLYPAHPSLQVCRTLYAKCTQSKYILVTYDGEEQCLPTNFVPIAGNSVAKAFMANDRRERNPFSARLILERKTHDGQNKKDNKKVQLVCVMTIKAICTWLAILGCMQWADLFYTGASPTYLFTLSIYNEDALYSRKQSLLYRMIGLIPQHSIELDFSRAHLGNDQQRSVVKYAEDRSAHVQEYIKTSRRGALIRSVEIYGAWLKRSLALGQYPSLPKSEEAHANYCACICRLLIGINCTESGKAEADQLTEQVRLKLNQRGAAAVVTWADEFFHGRGSEDLFEKLKDDCLKDGHTICEVPGCACLVWTSLGLTEVPVVSYEAAERCGIVMPLWLGICRRAVLRHCTDRIRGGNDRAFKIARDEMLRINDELKKMSLSKFPEGFEQDLDAFNTVADNGVKTLAHHHGIDMADDTKQTVVNTLMGALTLIVNPEKTGELERQELKDAALPARGEELPSPLRQSDIIPVTELISTTFAHPDSPKSRDL